MELLDLRKEIDRIDRQMVSLFEERMEIAGEVANVKIASGQPIFDPIREKEKLVSLGSLTHSEFNRQAVEDLYTQIMSISRKFQHGLIGERNVLGGFEKVESLHTAGSRVVYQGAPGAYSQLAAMRFFADAASHEAVNSFREVMEVLRDDKADYGVLPIENTTAGSVHEIYELLASFDSVIVKEEVLPIEQCLLAPRGTRMDQIQTVYSHPQSLAQSAKFLEEQGWQQIAMKNNAFAAREVAALNDPRKAAIAGEHAAGIYGLDVLQKGVHDEGGNATRFVCIHKRHLYEARAKKISICFEVPHQSGSLYHMLSHFIYNKLNMTKIESRPIEGKTWEYRFFVDFDGNLSDAAVQNALFGLSHEAALLKVLGNY